MSALVVGVGNPLRADDGFGPRAAEALEALALPGVRALAVHGLAPELADDLAAADLAVFVDVALDLPPGATRESPLEPRPPAALGHALEPGALLALCRALHGRAPRAVALAVGPESLAHGEGLSACVAAALPWAVGRAAALARDGR